VEDKCIRKTRKKHVERVHKNRSPKIKLYYKPNGKRKEVTPQEDGRTNSWKRVDGTGFRSLKSNKLK